MRKVVILRNSTIQKRSRNKGVPRRRIRGEKKKKRRNLLSSIRGRVVIVSVGVLSDLYRGIVMRTMRSGPRDGCNVAYTVR